MGKKFWRDDCIMGKFLYRNAIEKAFENLNLIHGDFKQSHS